MTLPLRALCVAASASAALLLVTGCSFSPVLQTSASSQTLAPIHGRLHGGQQPVSGASVQLYAANAVTNQGPSTALLSQPVITASDGTFSITGRYTCPASNPLVYIVATGGNPGLPGSVNNAGLAMMSLLGTCNTLLNNAASTFIFIDELTTVVSVQAVAPFMIDYTHIGSDPANPTGLGGAFDTASSEVDFSTGQFSGGTGNLSLPEVTFNTLADIIAACINTSGSGTPCSNLFSNTGGTSDTIAAALQMTRSPGQNTAALYNLVSPNPPFQPYFTSAPTDFTATVGYTAPAALHTGTLDSNGHIWLYLAGYQYNTASDTSTDTPGYIAVYDNNFNQLFTVTPGTGGLYYPDSLGRDANGHVFAINANNTVSEFDTNGAALSPANGWPTGLPSAFSPTGPGNGYVTNPNQGGPIQVDALGNIWGDTPFSGSAGNCYFELNSLGVNITPTGNFCTVAGSGGTGISAVDGQGSAWSSGTSSIAKVDALGGLAATAPASQGCFYPESNIFTAPNILLAFESVTLGLTYDRVHNQLWGFSETGAGAITDAGAALFCDYGSTPLPVIQQYTSTSTTPGAPYSAGSTLLNSATLDGAGNFWFVTGGVAATGVVGPTTGTFTGTATYSFYLSELSPTGTLLTPYNPATQVYGLQPTGFGANATAASTTGSIFPGVSSVGLLGVDRFGNIWAADTQTNKLLKITGLAAANTVNY